MLGYILPVMDPIKYPTPLEGNKYPISLVVPPVCKDSSSNVGPSAVIAAPRPTNVAQ